MSAAMHSSGIRSLCAAATPSMFSVCDGLETSITPATGGVIVTAALTAAVPRHRIRKPGLTHGGLKIESVPGRSNDAVGVTRSRLSTREVPRSS